jgi:hypothetical protein
MVIGTALVGFDPNRMNPVILSLPHGHALYAKDVVGVALIALASAVLWRTPRHGLLAIVAVAVGTVLIGFNSNRMDPVFLTLPRGHGLHVRDALGVVLITFGTALLWRAQPPSVASNSGSTTRP